jgi:hypothetical protein
MAELLKSRWNVNQSENPALREPEEPNGELEL